MTVPLTRVENTYPKPIPLPDECQPPLAFRSEMVPEVIAAKVEGISARLGCSPDFVAVSSIVSIAGIIGCNAELCPKTYDNWTVTANLYGYICGKPSSMKSPAMAHALAPLKKHKQHAFEQHKCAIQTYDAQQKLEKALRKNTEKRADKLVREGKNEQAMALFKAQEEATPEAPLLERLVINDATTAKVGEIMSENPSGLLLVRDELSGWLAEMQKEENQQDRAFYLECYNGTGSFTFDRIGRGTIHIPSCCLSIIGGIQPGKLQPLLRSVANGRGDDGFIQRFQLAVWPEHQPLQPYTDRAPCERTEQFYQQLIDRIYTQRQTGEKKHYRFNGTAQALFIEWYDEHRQLCNAEDIPPALESHLLKMRKTIPALALVFAIVHDEVAFISEHSLAMALEWSDYLISHARKIYGALGQNDIAHAKTIVERKAKLPDMFAPRHIRQKNWSGLIKQDCIESALALLQDHHYLFALEDSTTGGRPSKKYFWNPEA